MIHVRSHNLLFVEVPLTGSTAIRAELLENYAGESILRKHATVWELATTEGLDRRTIVVAGIRNPLDSIVSAYEKFRGNHRENYTTPSRHKANGGWVTDEQLARYEFIQRPGVGFADYVRRFHPTTLHDLEALTHARADVHIRFEDLQAGFSKALEVVGLEQVRPLPQVNRTSGKRPFLEYYGPELRQHAVDVFGPLMLRHGYRWPETWDVAPPSRRSRLALTLTAQRQIARGRLHLARQSRRGRTAVSA